MWNSGAGFILPAGEIACLGVLGAAPQGTILIRGAHSMEDFSAERRLAYPTSVGWLGWAGGRAGWRIKNPIKNACARRA
jgi:hypothetical protein